MNITVKSNNINNLTFKANSENNLPKPYEHVKHPAVKKVPFINSSFLIDGYNRAMLLISSKKANKLENRARDLSEIFHCLDEYKESLEGNHKILAENIEDFIEKVKFYSDSIETAQLIDVANIGTDENGFILFPKGTFGFEAKGVVSKASGAFCHEKHHNYDSGRIDMIIGKERTNDDGSFVAGEFLDFDNGEYLKNVQISSDSTSIYAQQAITFEADGKGVLGNLADVMGGPVLVNGLSIIFGKLTADSIIVFDVDEDNNIVGASTYENVEINGLKFYNQKSKSRQSEILPELTLKAETLCDTAVSDEKLTDVIYYKNYSSKGDSSNLVESANFVLEMNSTGENLAFANLEWNRSCVNNATNSRVKEPVRI